jgi:hypothetical protein
MTTTDAPERTPLRTFYTHRETDPEGDEDGFSPCCEFSTSTGAAESAAECIGLDPGDTFYVVELSEHDAAPDYAKHVSLDAELIIDDISDATEYNDHAIEGLRAIEKKHGADLVDRMRAAFVEWHRAHAPGETIMMIESTEQCTVAEDAPGATADLGHSMGGGKGGDAP